MLKLLLIFAAGALVGWNFPQPAWAVAAQAWLLKKWKEWFGK